MAMVRVTHKWPDESVSSITIDFEDSYPDAMERAVHAALDGWADMVTEDPDEASS